MSRYQISINQMADFQKSSYAKKKSIIRQQKTPNPFKISYYQLAKARMKKSFERNGDLNPILLGIDELKKRTLTKPRQINDRKVSLEAMRRFISMQLPSILSNSEYEVIKKPSVKSVVLNGVEIIISPDVIIRMKIDGKLYLGGVKIHIAKSNVFDYNQQKSVAGGIYKYLKDVVAQKDEVVDSKLCLSVDVFGRGVVAAPKNTKSVIREIGLICDEIKEIWHRI